MSAPSIEDVLHEHILYRYGTCSCGAEFTRHGKYSRDHRVHVAAAIRAEALPALLAEERERVAQAIENGPQRLGHNVSVTCHCLRCEVNEACAHIARSGGVA